jgi:hypothetical protein
VPVEATKGKGKQQQRGQGKGPLGVPNTEQNTMNKIDNLVDEILTGNYKKVKMAEQAGDLVDVILDNYGKDYGKKKMMENEDYKAYFKTMLKKYGYDSPADIPADKKKEFFNAVDKGWKGEKVSEIANDIDHVPDESPEDEHDKIKDQLGKPAVSEVENSLDSEPKQDADDQLSSLEDEMSKEEKFRTESAADLVKKAFMKVREEKISVKEIKEDLTNPVYLVAKAFAELQEDWGDVAGSVLRGVSGQAEKEAINREIEKTKQKIDDAKQELSKCGDSKWCKVKKHAQIVALSNHIDELRRRRGY